MCFAGHNILTRDHDWISIKLDLRSKASRRSEAGVDTVLGAIVRNANRIADGVWKDGASETAPIHYTEFPPSLYPGRCANVYSPKLSVTHGQRL